ncbi:MAG: sigma factor [Pyrinomonadaceae bacterium]
MATDDGLTAFESVRPRLFGKAYRMLGHAAEAEDIVQDATFMADSPGWCTYRFILGMGFE